MAYLPSITALRCLDASVRWGSFTRAAQEMHLTQSAVSHHILSLERQLGVKLFGREHGRVQPTQAGKMYWEETLSVLQQLRLASQRVTASKRGHDTLTISVPPSFGNVWLMPRVGQFVSNNPDITLNLLNLHDRRGDAYEEDDATIELSEGNATGTVSIRLLSLVYCPYASPALLRRLNVAHHLSEEGVFAASVLTELLGAAPLIRTSMADAWEGWLRLSNRDEAVDPAHLADGPAYAQASLALTAVINGTGVALLPKHVVDAHLPTGAVVRLSEIGWHASRAYHLQWSAGRPVTPPLRRFADWAATIAESEAS